MSFSIVFSPLVLFRMWSETAAGLGVWKLAKVNPPQALCLYRTRKSLFYRSMGCFLVSFYFLFYSWEVFFYYYYYFNYIYIYIYLGLRLPSVHFPPYILLLAAGRDSWLFHVCLFHRIIQLYLISITVNLKILTLAKPVFLYTFSILCLLIIRYAFSFFYLHMKIPQFICWVFKF